MNKEFVVTDTETIVSDENGQLQRYSISRNLEEQLNVHNEIEKIEENMEKRYGELYSLKRNNKSMKSVKGLGIFLLILEVPLATSGIIALPELSASFSAVLSTFGLLPLLGAGCISIANRNLEEIKKYRNGTIESIGKLKLELYECTEKAKSLENNMIIRRNRIISSKVVKLPIRETKNKVESMDDIAFCRGYNREIGKKRILSKKCK